MAKAAFIDLGGVLIDNPAEPLIAYASSKLHIPVSVLKPSLEKYLPSWQQGMFSESTFWNLVSNDCDQLQQVTESIWTEALKSCYQEKTDVFNEFSKWKQRGYKLAVLSNTEAPVAAFIKKQSSYRLFDELILSCDIGLIKPSCEIFYSALNKMNVSAQESVFFDDRPINIEGAQAVGMRSILFTGSVSDILLT